LIVLAGCAAELETGSRSDAVVYGEDGRMEVYESTDELLTAAARQSVGAVVDRRLVLDPTMPRALPLNDFLIAQEGVPLCEEEPYADQPVLATCSGVLIGADLFLTASHCVPTQEFCDDLRVVFGWYFESEGVMPAMGADDVYECQAIEVISYARDYAILRLDRRVAERYVPAELRPGSEGELFPDDRVSVIGFPSGIPAKIDDSGRVLGRTGTESFAFYADVFEGSSGSPVFDNRGRVVGVVSTGTEVDWRVSSSCARTNTEDDGDGDGVVAGYTYRAIRDLCAQGGGPPRLCGAGIDWCPDCPKLGGCSAAGGEGGWLFALLGLALLRRRRR